MESAPFEEPCVSEVAVPPRMFISFQSLQGFGEFWASSLFGRVTSTSVSGLDGVWRREVDESLMGDLNLDGVDRRVIGRFQ